MAKVANKGKTIFLWSGETQLYPIGAHSSDNRSKPQHHPITKQNTASPPRRSRTHGTVYEIAIQDTFKKTKLRLANLEQKSVLLDTTPGHTKTTKSAVLLKLRQLAMPIARITRQNTS